MVQKQTMQGRHEGYVKFLKPGLLCDIGQVFLFSFLSVSGLSLCCRVLRAWNGSHTTGLCYKHRNNKSRSQQHICCKLSQTNSFLRHFHWLWYTHPVNLAMTMRSQGEKGMISAISTLIYWKEFWEGERLIKAEVEKLLVWHTTSIYCVTTKPTLCICEVFLFVGLVFFLITEKYKKHLS